MINFMNRHASRIAAVWVALFGLLAMSASTVAAQDQPKKSDEPAKVKAKTQTQTKKARTPRRPAHEHTDKTYMGREIAQVMSYFGADWLVRESRLDEEQPEKMLDALEIKEGQTVADVGAGVGFHSLRMAKRVGPEGKVYASDVQPEMLKMLERNAKAAKISNITPVLCTQTDTKLPDGQIDLILMVDVYHECSQPETTLQGLRKALKPKGRLVLVEFRGEDPTVPIKEEHKMTVAQVRKEIEPQGFKLLKVHDFLPWQHIIVFEKGQEPAPAQAPGEAKSKDGTEDQAGVEASRPQSP